MSPNNSRWFTNNYNTIVIFFLHFLLLVKIELNHFFFLSLYSCTFPSYIEFSLQSRNIYFFTPAGSGTCASSAPLQDLCANAASCESFSLFDMTRNLQNFSLLCHLKCFTKLQNNIIGYYYSSFYCFQISFTCFVISSHK